MDKKQIKYCTLLLINDHNHSKIYISEENKYYIRSDGSIRIKIFNEFEDIRKSYRKSYRKINIIHESDKYYCKSDGYDDIKDCTILLIDDGNHIIYLFLKKMCIILNILIIMIVMIMIVIMIIMKFIIIYLLMILSI